MIVERCADLCDGIELMKNNTCNAKTKLNKAVGSMAGWELHFFKPSQTKHARARRDSQEAGVVQCGSDTVWLYFKK